MSDKFFNQDEILHYSRHLMIPEIGIEGQRKLKESSVLIIGAGGLGSPVSMYLAAAGVGRIGLVDDDVIDPSNLQRQILYETSQIGKSKVEQAQARLKELNPHIKIETYLDTFNRETAPDIAANYDVIADCSDNFATRYLVNDLCVLTGKPDVFGAVYRFEGQVSVFYARKGPCYRCLFPDAPPEGVVPACGEAGIMGVVPGIVGCLQAAEVIKLLVEIGEPLIGKLLMISTLEMDFKTIRLEKKPGCEICGEKPTITELIDYESFCGTDTIGLSDSEMISAKELDERLKMSQPPLLVDVRTPIELQISSLPGAVNIPIDHLSEKIDTLNKDSDIVVFCRTGVRSKRALKLLKEAGFKKVKNLTGGINAWAMEIATDMYQY